MAPKTEPNMSLGSHIEAKKSTSPVNDLSNMFPTIAQLAEQNSELSSSGAYGLRYVPIVLWTPDNLGKHLEERNIAHKKTAWWLPELVEVLEVSPLKQNANRKVLCRFQHNNKNTDLWMNSTIMLGHKEYARLVKKALVEHKRQHVKEKHSKTVN